MLVAFWWGTEDHHRKIHWVFWERLCLPIDQGGMGFRDLEVFNQAMLAKQAWKVLSSPDCFLASLLKSRCFLDGEFLYVSLGARPSYAWCSLLYGRELLMKGLRHKVGNGRQTRVWLDKWIADLVEGLRAPWIKNATFDVNLRASALIDLSTRKWNEGALNEVFVPSDIEYLLRNQPVVSKEDFKVWNLTRSDQFSMKSAYQLAFSEKTKVTQPETFNQPSVNSLKEKVWKVPTLPKIRVFVWKVLNGALPVADLLESRGIPYPRLGFHENSISENISYLLHLRQDRVGDSSSPRMWSWLLWVIWKARNELLFKSIMPNPSNILLRAKQETEEWFEAQTVKENLQLQLQFKPKKGKARWKPPLPGWTMCSLDDAKLVGVLWSLESMGSQRISNVVVAGEFAELFGAVERSQAWPSFLHQIEEIKRGKDSIDGCMDDV
ncbi:uncharacterized protein LOC103854117 [Brassica rapa]|uniref:uncharacterized protein LOC103854117 n=1 Tax=Brassica campestris TaxID=3711 RepID=UPI0004F1B9C5|nr:uncharacterized protein LOC103854117 [Brassica rapa]